MKSTIYASLVLMKLEIFVTDFRKKKTHNYQFSGSPSSGSRVVPCGRTEGQT